MKVRVGQTLVSAVDSTAVIVIRIGDDVRSITCGGADMLDGPERGVGRSAETSEMAASGEGAQLGKRYGAEGIMIELLCTRPGRAALAVNGVPLVVRTPRALPASD
jgi:hypothetical protein